MTVEELINKLREFPPETPVRFCSDGGHLQYWEPGFNIEVDEDQSGPGPERSILFIDIDG